jgi:hypothetical protein
MLLMLMQQPHQRLHHHPPHRPGHRVRDQQMHESSKTAGVGGGGESNAKAEKQYFIYHPNQSGA